jgi:hypothetical protein
MKTFLSAHNFNQITDKILNKTLSNKNLCCITTLVTLGKELTFTSFYPNLLLSLFSLIPNSKWLRKCFAKQVQKIITNYNRKAFNDLSNYIKNTQGKNVYHEIMKKHELIPSSLSSGEEIITPEKHRQILRIALIESYLQRLLQNYSLQEAHEIIESHFTQEMQKGTQAIPKIQRETLSQRIKNHKKLA